MDDMITSMQRGLDQQLEVLNGTFWSLKWLFPSLPGKTKDYNSIKKMMAGKGNWTYTKEVLGWLINIEAGKLVLLEPTHMDILQLVSIPATQCRMVWKELERLVGKICPMHLMLPGEVAHLYHTHRDLSQGGKDRDWLSSYFNQEIDNWSALMAHTVSCLTYLADIVH